MTIMFDYMIYRPNKTTTFEDIDIPFHITLSFSIDGPSTTPAIISTAVIGAREWASDHAVLVRVSYADHRSPSTRDNNEDAHDDEEHVQGDERFKAQGFIYFAVTPVIMQPHPAFCNKAEESAQSCTDETDKISKKWNC